MATDRPLSAAQKEPGAVAKGRSRGFAEFEARRAKVGREAAPPPALEKRKGGGQGKTQPSDPREPGVRQRPPRSVVINRTILLKTLESLDVLMGTTPLSS